MTSDISVSTIDDQPPKKARGQILRSEIEEGVESQQRPLSGLFFSGLSAGLDIGFSALLMAVMWTLTDGHLPQAISRLLIANMYAVGFVFVVVGRSELFTEQTTLAVLPMLSRETTFASLLRLWGIVYVSNLLGATAFAFLAATIAPDMGVASARAFGAIAERMIAHGSQTIFSAPCSPAGSWD